MGAPLNVSNNNQLFGILMELSNYIESRNDNSNAEIISYINNLSSIRNNTDRAEALQFLENLGLNSQQPQPIQPQAKNVEKVAYLKDLPKEECPICLENLDGSGYSTEKCKHNFHKKCLDRHCLNKRECLCPMCRRSLKFINSSGGKKRRTKKKRQSKKTKKSLKKFKYSKK
jgi:hypothetical protein